MQIIDVNSLNSSPLASKELGSGETRCLIRTRTCDVPVLIRNNPTWSRRLLVTFNGAIQRSKAPDGVVFQRSTWLDDFNACVIQIADPTMCVNKTLQIGWAQYSHSEWAIDSYLEVIRAIRQEFGFAEPEQTLHFGSSAGGFQAACVAALDKGSVGMLNNPQLDWTKYNPRFVDALLRNVFDGATIDEIRRTVPWRANVFDFFERVGYAPPLDIFTNISSASDFDDQLIPAMEKIRQFSDYFKRPRIAVELYSDEALGHNPLPKPTTIERINRRLEDIS